MNEEENKYREAEKNNQSSKVNFYSRLPKSLTTVTTFSKLIALFLFILLPFAGFYIGMSYQQKIGGSNSLQTACTLEAKICPDGSYTTRAGPKCEFTPCPAADASSSASVNSILLLNQFTNLNGKNRYILSKTEPDLHGAHLNQQVIYFSDNGEDLINFTKIFEVGSQNEITEPPHVSTNQGKKYVAFQIVGAGDVHRVDLFDENGKKVQLDFSKISESQGNGVTQFVKWVGNTTQMELYIGSFGSNSHDAIFDAATGNLVGLGKLIPK